MARRPVLEAEDTRRTLADLFGLIRVELADAERIFQHELRSKFPFVQHLVDHCGDYQGKRLRPALLLLSGRACGSMTDGSSGPGRRGRDDPHRHARSRRRPRRVDGAPPCRHGQRRVGKRDRGPAGRLSVHARLPPGGIARDDPGLPVDRPGDQPGLRGRDAAGSPSRQPRTRRAIVLRHHRRKDRRAHGRLVPAGCPLLGR